MSPSYGLVIGLFVYRDLKLADLPRILATAMVKVGTLMTVAASALIFAWVLTILEVPQAMAEAILSRHAQPDPDPVASEHPVSVRRHVHGSQGRHADPGCLSSCRFCRRWASIRCISAW